MLAGGVDHAGGSVSSTGGGEGGCALWGITESVGREERRAAGDPPQRGAEPDRLSGVERAKVARQPVKAQSLEARDHGCNGLGGFLD